MITQNLTHMSTIETLKNNKGNYEKLLKKLEKRLEALSFRKYSGEDMPAELREEITLLHKDIEKMKSIINNIDITIDTIHNEI